MTLRIGCTRRGRVNRAEESSMSALQDARRHSVLDSVKGIDDEVPGRCYYAKLISGSDGCTVQLTTLHGEKLATAVLADRVIAVALARQIERRDPGKGVFPQRDSFPPDPPYVSEEKVIELAEKLRAAIKDHQAKLIDAITVPEARA